MPSGIRITKNSITPLLKKTGRKLTNSRAFIIQLANGIAKDVFKPHFRDLEKRRSPTSHFYSKQGADVTKATNFTKSSAEIQVQSVQMAHKYFGGTITAKRTKNLAIPLKQETKYRTPSKYGNRREMFFIKTRRGTKFLAERKGNGKELNYLYLLTHQVRQRAFKDVMPEMSDVKKYAENLARSYFTSNR